MGRFFWAFHRIDDGDITALPVAQFEAWRRGEVPLRPLDGYVYTIFVAGPCEARTPLSVEFLEFSRHVVTAKGMRSQRQIRNELRDVFDGMNIPALPHAGNLLDGRSRFIRARNKAKWGWAPTQSDIEALRAAINKKARRPLT